MDSLPSRPEARNFSRVRGTGGSEKIVVVAASEGGLTAFSELISALPPDFPAALVFVQHLPPTSVYQSILRDLLREVSKLPVKWIEHGDYVSGGIVYVAPQDMQARIDGRFRFHLSAEGALRPTADPLFTSASERFGPNAIGIVLTGNLQDGAKGACDIVRAGGTVFAQDNETAAVFAMPDAAIRSGAADFILSPKGMAHALVTLLMAPGADAWFRVSRVKRRTFDAVIPQLTDEIRPSY